MAPSKRKAAAAPEAPAAPAAPAPLAPSAVLSAAPSTPHAPPSPTPTPPSLLMAAIEAFGCHMFLSTMSGLVGSALRPVLAGAGVLPPALLPDALGLLRLLVVGGVFSMLYGQRFRPRMDPGRASVDAARRLCALLMAPRWHASATLLLVFHALQAAAMVAAAAWVRGGVLPSLAAATACMSRADVLWGVAYEELVYRAVIFYVALQRSGGSVRYAVLLSAAVFGGVHVSIAVRPGAQLSMVGLHVLTAASFGATYGLLFAATGSLAATVALHAANNAAALLWQALDASPQAAAAGIGALADGSVIGAAACTTVYSTPLLASVALQAGVYVAAGIAAYASLVAALVTPAPATGGSGGGSNAFRVAHPMVYGGEGVAAGDVAGSAGVVAAYAKPKAE